jgi:hypothetical protein
MLEMNYVLKQCDQRITKLKSSEKVLQSKQENNKIAENFDFSEVLKLREREKLIENVKSYSFIPIKKYQNGQVNKLEFLKSIFTKY